ncbi:MAG TPA: agmatine deiminase family protein [Candidatus Limnocylindrales bacterium]|nr:agmatine deiminase family protein [Candidatus Limnocylindrales bacterium]
MPADHIDSPRGAGFCMPAEWEPHRAVWTAWPSHRELWLEDLPAAQREVADLCRAIAALDDDGKAAGEMIELLVLDDAGEREAAAALSGLPVRFHQVPFGDIWLRDTAPLFVRGANGEVAAACFRFNGWGEKYMFPEDLGVARAVRAAAGVHSFEVPMIFEGGAIEVDGEGTALTTRQCLLHGNRNPSLSAAEIAHHLCDALGVQRLLWLGDGLVNDHTDGHIDTLVRFVAPGRVVCMEARDEDDPNAPALARILQDLTTMHDAAQRPLEIVRIPSPGLLRDGDGRVMPASYVNFYIGNAAVIVPVYGSRHDDEAVEGIAACFPDRRTVAVPARAVLSGGGAFHCITQQEPAPLARS